MTTKIYIWWEQHQDGRWYVHATTHSLANWDGRTMHNAMKITEVAVETPKS